MTKILKVRSVHDYNAWTGQKDEHSLVSVSTKDSYQNSIIVNLIDIILQYCMRFYNHQFSAPRPQISNILIRFEDYLDDYFTARKQHSSGLPSVQLCASALCLSTNYFADLVKKQTGETASGHIHRFITNRAKSLLMSGLSINETAYELGFEYPQHFSRMFKKAEHCSPTEYLLKRGVTR